MIPLYDGARLPVTEQLSSRAYLIKLPANVDLTACRLSLENNGDFWSGRQAITWHCGNRTVTLLYEGAERAREHRTAVQELIGGELKPHVWTLGQLARLVIRYIGITNRGCRFSREVLQECGYTYMYCNPTVAEQGVMWDKTGAYWNLLKRLKSPLLTISPHGPIWRKIPSETEERWNRVKIHLEPYKQLRNALVGAMIPGDTAYCWRAGEKIRRIIKGDTAIYDTGVLIIRTNHEQTQEQVRALGDDCCYANNDSVCALNGRTPDLWQATALPFRVTEKEGKLALGDVDVRMMNVWRVGEFRTEYYRPGSSRAVHGQNNVEVIYSRWLT